MSYKKFYVN